MRKKITILACVAGALALTWALYTLLNVSQLLAFI